MNIVQEMEMYNQLEKQLQQEMIREYDELYQTICDLQRKCKHTCSNCVAYDYCDKEEKQQ